MAVLAEHQKIFIVQQLALFDTLEEVRVAVKAEFGIDMSRQQIHSYNPTTHSGRNLSPKYKKLFADTRKAFQENVSAIPLANQANRVRELEKLYNKARDMGNIALSAQLLEQMSKETGGAYTNRIKAEHTGKDGGPIAHQRAIINITGAPPSTNDKP